MTVSTHTTPKLKTMAIIGSGVSGLTCAHYLIDSFDVTIFEANEYLGGHVNTIDVALSSPNRLRKDTIETAAIDTGFIVFNERTYPNFFRLLDELQVPFQKTDMSFSLKNPAINFEYNGHTLNSLLSQRKNIISPKFWRFAKDIVTFNHHIKKRHQTYKDLTNDIKILTETTQIFTKKPKLSQRNIRKLQAQLVDKNHKLKLLSQETLGDYLSQQPYGDLFKDNYLLPMVSAIWSVGLTDCKAFPMVFFAQFFDNHGLLDIVKRPQWFSIKGGSKQYVDKLVTRYKSRGGKALINSPVQSVTRHNSGVTINYTDHNGINQSAEYAEVIFACHANVAKRLLDDVTGLESDVLGTFTFSDNDAILHTDTRILPKKPLAWASWNYLLPTRSEDSVIKESVKDNLADNRLRNIQSKSSVATGDVKPVLTYNMNILQRLVKKHNYLVTLNAPIDDAHVVKRIRYHHPIYSIDMTLAQQQWHRLANQDNHTHFCGAYWYNGFHEDGVKSALRVCKQLGLAIETLDTVNPAHLRNVLDPYPVFDYTSLPTKADSNARHLKKRKVLHAQTNVTLNELFR